MEQLGNLLKSTMTSSINKQPDPKLCEFCGKAIQPKSFLDMGKHWYFPSCGCEGEQEHEKEKERKLIEEQELKWKLQRIEGLLKKSNLGRRFQNRKFETFTIEDWNRRAFDIAYAYAVNFQQNKENGAGLFFTGPVGTGKTHLTAAIANHLLPLGNEVIFGNVTTHLGNIRNAYSEDGESELSIIRNLTGADLLIIDDLGKEKMTDWVYEKLYTIINTRYEDYKPLIVTTNLTIPELENRIGEATISRIIEMCQGIRLEGPDQRKEKLR